MNRLLVMGESGHEAEKLRRREFRADDRIDHGVSLLRG
jgi:hypothetical protein